MKRKSRWRVAASPRREGGVLSFCLRRKGKGRTEVKRYTPGTIKLEGQGKGNEIKREKRRGSGGSLAHLFSP